MVGGDKKKLLSVGGAANNIFKVVLVTSKEGFSPWKKIFSDLKKLYKNRITI